MAKTNQLLVPSQCASSGDAEHGAVVVAAADDHARVEVRLLDDRVPVINTNFQKTLTWKFDEFTNIFNLKKSRKHTLSWKGEV